MRKETQEYLRIRHSPEEVLSEYRNSYDQWKEKFRSHEYTFPKKLFISRGGMALGAAAANGVASRMSELGITFPGVIASSASAMTWGMIQMDYTPLEIHSHVTSFKMSHLHHDQPFGIIRDKSVYNIRNLMRHYLRFDKYANSLEMTSDSDINLGFLTTKMPDREPHLYKDGKLITGILATGAFPLAFPPIKDKYSNLLIDGDMSHKLPISQIEDFLGFRPEEIIYARLDLKSKTANTIRNGLGLLTNTPRELPLTEWADGIPVHEILVKPDAEVIKDMHSTDYHDAIKMDHIFQAGVQAVNEFYLYNTDNEKKI